MNDQKSLQWVALYRKHSVKTTGLDARFLGQDHSKLPLVLAFRAALAVAMCGWRFRRASKAIGRRVLYLAKVSQQLWSGKGVDGDTWTQAVLSLMNPFLAPIPTIEDRAPRGLEGSGVVDPKIRKRSS